MSVNKYFIAIVIPPPLQQQIEDVKQELFSRYGLKGALRSPAHITLHRPFEWKAEKEEALISKLKSFPFEPGGTIVLENFNCFAPRVIYVGVEQTQVLSDLYQELKKYALRELKLLNEVNDLRGFHPHVTVAFRDLKKNRFEEIWAEYKDRKIGGEFELKGFSLMRHEGIWKEIAFFKGEAH